jgi:hypothetical protein
MFRHVRPARRLQQQRPLALEPLEDRLLLSIPVGPLPASARGLNQNPPASVTHKSTRVSTPDADADAPPGGYASGQTDTTPETEQATRATPSTNLGYAQATGAQAGHASSQGQDTPWQGNSAVSYASSSDSHYTTSHANSGTESGDTPAEYYPQVSASTPREAASNASPITTAVLGMVTVATAIPTPLPPVARAQGPAFINAPPVQAVAPGNPVAPAGAAEVRAPAPAEAAWEAFQSGLPEVALTPEGNEEAGPVLPALEASRLFPLALPLPVRLLPVDVAAWERSVRELFNRLEALGDEPAEMASWGRLAPWCAALGGITLALEIVRRRLSKRYPPALAEATGRGLAWRWSPEPDSGEPPEQP